MSSKISVSALRGVPESLLLPMYFRAVEARSAVPLIVDSKAAEMIEQLDHDFAGLGEASMDQFFAVLRVREFDRRARAFLAAHPNGVIVDIGCGLDTRFERLDNGTMEWFGLDLPEVVALRRQLLRETPRSHFLAGSALDVVWMEQSTFHTNQGLLFLAEGVLPYFQEADVRRLVIALKDKYPGAELVFDAMSPLFVVIHNLELMLRRTSFRLGWGLRNSQDLESWAPGIRLVREWFYFDEPEVLARRLRLLRYIPCFRKGTWVAQYSL